MSAITQPFPTVQPVSARLREVRLHWAVLGQICLCAVPPMALVFTGRPALAAHVLVGLLAPIVAFNVYQRRRYEVATIAIGCLPVVAMLRGIYFYYSGLLVLAGGLLMWVVYTPQGVRRLWNDLAWRSMAIFAFIYFWWCAVITGDYVSQLRFLELVLSSGCVLLLADRRSYLATALLGMWISTSMVAIGLLPYGDRLGLATIDDIRIGNPILLGVPAVLLLMLVVADGGQWLLLQSKPAVRILLGLVMVLWLLLSGSRGSWIAAGCGLLVLAFSSKRDRGVLLAFLAIAALGVALGLTTSRGEIVTKQIDRTLDDDRSLEKRTSGRSDQWMILPAVFAESPIWGWGPGTGRDVVYMYMGRHLAWHSLYLQLLAETGLIGFGSMVWFMAVLIGRGIRHFRRFKEVTPLVCLFTYLIIGASVQGIDAVSGVFIGLCLLAVDTIPRYRVSQNYRMIEEHA